ncbi:TetR-like C-terminal domain-containing protein [Methylobrevis albus]|uniref:WHG domain-containing protein n=1 Tax=Methylobrevis albus TaxID=2793297 RepID=A0A931I4E6_9HYPH|nr:TetR-like C-terminal domain-containing protein [Methylobrevis albus]MBH0238686.1 WHG domain-containing protein [Methylobrevis albus]
MAKDTQRRTEQRAALIAAAEAAIAGGGLGALKARDLAATLGCAVGAIYTLVADLDELVLLVGSRTLARLDAALAAADAGADGAGTDGTEAAVRRLEAVALAYARFAHAETALWRALFEFRMAPEKALPDWSVADQIGLFVHVDAPLAALLPGLDPERRGLLARSLFSAVHGILALGLEGKLVAVPQAHLEAQIALVVRAACRGLVAEQAEGPPS